MYLESPAEAQAFAKSLRKKSRAFEGVDAWLAPSFLHVAPVAATLKGSSIKIGAQTVSPSDSAQSKAHTGDVSADMLKQAGASFCLVGHSERRHPSANSGQAAESDEAIRSQLIVAIGAGLTAILCVGEHERHPDGSHFQTIANQLGRALHGLREVNVPSNRLIVAYEPVWAIGKSADEAMEGEDLEEMAIFIRKILAEQLGREWAHKVTILYGGSVEPANARALMEAGGVNGFLVGHASTDVDSFIAILKSCKK